MATLSYIIETNDNSPVYVEYRELDYVPENVVWDGSNTFPNSQSFPDADSYESPEYVRCVDTSGYAYYRRMVCIPPKASSFKMTVLSDGVVTMFSYDVFGYLTCSFDGSYLIVSSKTNTSGGDTYTTISIVDNLSGDTMSIPFVQEYVPIHLVLGTYESESELGDDYGEINDIFFEHTFHWLTSKGSPDKETLSVSVIATGPRNGFIVREINEFVSCGNINSDYIVSGTDGSVYETMANCGNEESHLKTEPVIFDEHTLSLYKKTKYSNDLNVSLNGNNVKITNYGRCFIQDDAYYDIVLANVDNITETCTIKIRYENEEP